MHAKLLSVRKVRMKDFGAKIRIKWTSSQHISNSRLPMDKLLQKEKKKEEKSQRSMKIEKKWWEISMKLLFPINMQTGQCVWACRLPSRGGRHSNAIWLGIVLKQQISNKSCWHCHFVVLGSLEMQHQEENQVFIQYVTIVCFVNNLEDLDELEITV